MARFLTTKGIGHEIERLISRSEEFIYLLSFNLDIGEEYIEKIKLASGRKVKIYIVFGVGKNKEEKYESIRNIKNVKILFRENLHAKIYFNEQEFILTSMNLSKVSENKNVELGTYFSKEEDLNLYNEAKREIEEIIQQSENIVTTIPNNMETKKPELYIVEKKENNKIGYCIKCGSQIEFNPKQPFCREHQREFAGFSSSGKTYYKFNYCHKKGDQKWGSKVTSKNPIRE